MFISFIFCFCFLFLEAAKRGNNLIQNTAFVTWNLALNMVLIRIKIYFIYIITVDIFASVVIFAYILALGRALFADGFLREESFQ